MAATATPSNLEEMILKLPKSVQEMSIKGDEPPQPLIVRHDVPFGPVDTSPLLASIPTIDISLFSPLPSSLESSIQETQNELDKLRSALSSWGCFQVIGHGISRQFLDKVREVTKLALQPVKRKLARLCQGGHLMRHPICRSSNKVKRNPLLLSQISDIHTYSC
ncbi:hypothetical protein RHMOL_Rhmol06G0013100 [Rhododendron molle]|uniref:Uncharacterized protein n=1 Tax=Rhododendron molle TaxID=49168 RepID=A0ACC0N8Q7_RHOML|nr:hypothetical protein RHMOL_Rhmol06G0013100 [Rhododendron molle]